MYPVSGIGLILIDSSAAIMQRRMAMRLLQDKNKTWNKGSLPLVNHNVSSILKSKIY